GEAEIDEHQPAAEIRIGAAPAVLIGERERAADRLPVPHHRIHQLGGGAFRRLSARRRRDDAEAEEQRNGEKRQRPGDAGHNAARILPQTDSYPDRHPGSAGYRTLTYLRRTRGRGSPANTLPNLSTVPNSGPLPVVVAGLPP